MYSHVLALHSLVRWLVLMLLLYSICRAYVGYVNNKSFLKSDDRFRHWTAPMAHIQLMIGMVLYTQSPMVKHFWSDAGMMLKNWEQSFYGFIHIFLMFISIIFLTIGSAMAKRKALDRDKFKTMLIWFSVALIIILIAIPWPFSPFSSRPYFRSF